MMNCEMAHKPYPTDIDRQRFSKWFKQKIDIWMNQGRPGRIRCLDDFLDYESNIFVILLPHLPGQRPDATSLRRDLMRVATCIEKGQYGKARKIADLIDRKHQTEVYITVHMRRPMEPIRETIYMINEWEIDVMNEPCTTNRIYTRSIDA